MSSTVQQPWIEHGYRTFAYGGPKDLRIERLANKVGKNKSSFYHHFADLEIFTTALLDHHLTQAQALAEKEAQCKTMDELIDLLVTHKTDLLFNRQLRIHRENPEFATCFQRTTDLTAPAIAGIWAEILGLEDHTHLAGLVLQLSIENFYLQITDETLNQTWLTDYFKQLQALVKAFKQTGKIPALDGTV